MSLHITEKELKRHIKNIGYNGCKNCKHQISPLRSCKWSERGGDGILHLVCPMWDKKEREEQA